MSSETENISLDLTVYKPERKTKVYKNDNQATDYEITGENNWRKELKEKSVFNLEQRANAFDVASYIVKKYKCITTMKLHKLLYYSQAWSLVWDEEPLFNEQIEAWANGPVIKELFAFHRGQYTINNISIGNINLLTQQQRETVDAVLDYYGDKSAQWLIQLTHMEDPWKEARKGLTVNERGQSIISLDSMANYYSSL